MEGFMYINASELEAINGGGSNDRIPAWEVVVDLLAWRYPPLGLFMTIKTISDYIDGQDW